MNHLPGAARKTPTSSTAVVAVLVVSSLSMAAGSLLQAEGSCDPDPNGGAVVFCDDFLGGAIDHSDTARPVSFDGDDVHWYPYGASWNSSSFVHGCELQYYTVYGADYSTAGPTWYAEKGHQTNFCPEDPAACPGLTQDTVALVLRQENGFKGYIPEWMAQPAPPCWMSWSHDDTAPPPQNNHYQHFDYTSGWLKTPMLFRYGHFEIRAKIPNQGRVAWPAFWLFGDARLEGGKASLGADANEIDIFEFTGYEPHRFTRNVHNYFNLSLWLDIYGDPAGYPELEECTAAHWSPTCNFHRDVAANTIIFHHGYHQDLSIDVGQWHTYALDWTPHRLTWFLDGQPIGPPLHTDVPTNAMTLIIDLALPDWLSHGVNNGVVDGDDTSLVLPASFEIDYVKVTAITEEDFVWKWGNGGGPIHWWVLNDDDSYLVGDFDSDAADELLALNPTSGYAHLMDFAPAETLKGGFQWEHQGPRWSTQWTNLGSDRIHWWSLNPGDVYLVGNFIQDPPSSGAKDEILAISDASGFVHLMRYDGSEWETPWSNLGAGQIHWWVLNPDDRYVVGNFDDDPEDELLAINERTGYAHLMDYQGGQWTTPWATASGKIESWIFHHDDSYVVGDFDDDGEDDLLAINASTGWAEMLHYDDAQKEFVGVWNNGGSFRIHWWDLHPGDRFAAADFDGDSGEELLAVNADALWSHLMRFDHGAPAPSFQYVWGTGHGLLHRPAHYLPGDFVPGSYSELLSVGGRWAYFQTYEVPGEAITFE